MSFLIQLPNTYPRSELYMSEHATTSNSHTNAMESLDCYIFTKFILQLDILKSWLDILPRQHEFRAYKTVMAFHTNSVSHGG